MEAAEAPAAVAVESPTDPEILRIMSTFYNGGDPELKAANRRRAEGIAAKRAEQQRQIEADNAKRRAQLDQRVRKMGL